MRTAITIGWTPENVPVSLIGPEVYIGEHVKAMAHFKSGHMPKGLVRVDRWESDRGIAATALARATVAVTAPVPEPPISPAETDVTPEPPASSNLPASPEGSAPDGESTKPAPARRARPVATKTK